ncbi:MAG: FMN-binding protein [Verrucomicrobia bacterium]|nr:FMN-binding protein [Verrucomicrobiota bacterium]
MSSNGRLAGSPWALALAAGCVFAATAAAKVLLTHDAALASHFPDATIERKAVFLTAEQLDQLAQIEGEKPRSEIVYAYEARRDGQLLGTAYLDSHQVRTLPETLLVAVDGSNRLVCIEVLTFDEPEDYLPRQRWYDQFQGRALDADLQLNRGIHGVTGATLTGRATVAAARRVLATHQVLSESKP